MAARLTHNEVINLYHLCVACKVNSPQKTWKSITRRMGFGTHVGILKEQLHEIMRSPECEWDQMIDDALKLNQKRYSETARTNRVRASHVKEKNSMPKDISLVQGVNTSETLLKSQHYTSDYIWDERKNKIAAYAKIRKSLQEIIRQIDVLTENKPKSITMAASPRKYAQLVSDTYDELVKIRDWVREGSRGRN